MGSGVSENRISQVRGFADQRLLFKDDRNNPSNRRISIIVRNQGLDDQEEAFAQAKRNSSAAQSPAPPAPSSPSSSPGSK
jgi:hypothetical protein